jgi:hypothetical protein
MAGGCSFDRGCPDIVVSSTTSFQLTLFTWKGDEYIRQGSYKFRYEKEKILSNIKFNRFCRNATEVFGLCDDSTLLKVSLNRQVMDRSNFKKLNNRQRKAVLDYRILRTDRIIMLTEGHQVILLDTYTGIELLTHSIEDMVHKNIFTFTQDQLNIDCYPYLLEDGEDGRLWLTNMKTTKEKIQRKT